MRAFDSSTITRYNTYACEYWWNGVVSFYKCLLQINFIILWTLISQIIIFYQIFTNCSCITSVNGNNSFQNITSLPDSPPHSSTTGTVNCQIKRKSSIKIFNPLQPFQQLYDAIAKPGSCPVNCYKQFVTFLAVMCVLKFVGSTGRATNFLVSIR